MIHTDIDIAGRRGEDGGSFCVKKKKAAKCSKACRYQGASA